VKNRLAIALVVVALVIGLMIAALLALMILRRGGGIRVANTPSVVMQIQSLSELVTVKYVIEKVIFAETTTTNIIDRLRGTDKIILLGHGIVKAGVDMSGVRAEDVKVNGNSIRLALPPAVVTDGYLDEDATQVLDRQTGLLRPYDRKLEQQARQEARTEILRAARKSGIEREANERAREQLTKFLQSLGYKEVEVRTRASK
jgi:hypothetical protein